MTVLCANHISANVPSIKTRQGPPNKPAKNRKASKVEIFGAIPITTTHSVKSGKLVKYIGRRPYLSATWGVYMGAKNTPKNGRVNPNSAARLEVS